MNRAGLLVLLVAGCAPRNVCERAADLSAECAELGEVVDTDLDGLACEDGSDNACFAQCAVDAHDALGCPGLTDPAQSADYIACRDGCLTP